MELFKNKLFYKVGQTEFDDNDAIRFYSVDGKDILMTHDQDCCESVFIESISGNLENLTEVPILRADEKITQSCADYDSQTATFYTLATIKGYVDIRWHGESNGYYSESVDVREIEGTVDENIREEYMAKYPEYFL